MWQSPHVDMSTKFKLSTESQQKIKDIETKEIQQARNSEAFCMDSYKSAAITSKVSREKLDLFSGLNQTVKVMETTILYKGASKVVHCPTLNFDVHNFTIYFYNILNF